jgi:hypothetical protein
MPSAELAVLCRAALLFRMLPSSSKKADSPSLQVSSAVSRDEPSGDTLISMNSDIGLLQLEESKASFRIISLPSLI